MLACIARETKSKMIDTITEKRSTGKSSTVDAIVADHRVQEAVVQRSVGREAAQLTFLWQSFAIESPKMFS